MPDRVKDAFLAAITLGQSIAAKNSHYRLKVPRAVDGPVVGRVPLPQAPEFTRDDTVFAHCVNLNHPKHQKPGKPKNGPGPIVHQRDEARRAHGRMAYRARVKREEQI